MAEIVAVPESADPNDAKSVAELAASVDELTLQTQLAKGFDDIDDWVATGIIIREKWRMLTWLAADWVVTGQDTFGESASQYLESLGLAGQTLANYASVARRFPPDTGEDGQPLYRKWDLPFGYYAAVSARKLGDEEVESLLTRAQSEGWIREDLRDEVRRLTDEEPGEDPGPLGSPQVPELPAPFDIDPQQAEHTLSLVLFNAYKAVDAFALRPHTDKVASAVMKWISSGSQDARAWARLVGKLAGG